MFSTINIDQQTGLIKEANTLKHVLNKEANITKHVLHKRSKYNKTCFEQKKQI